MSIARYLPFFKAREKKEKPKKKPFFFKLYEKNSQVILVLSVGLALFGILFLFMLPLLVLVLPLELYNSVIYASNMEQWINAGITLLVLALAAAFCWAIFQLKFTTPAGLEVTAEKFPKLANQVEELRNEFGQPRIDRVIISDKYELRTVKTPRAKMPFLYTTTLVIGLPVLLTMSPLYFRALLARRVGQLAGKHTPVTTRLYFLNDTWQQLKSSCKQSGNIFAKILFVYFKIYAGLYSKVVLPLVQSEELEADSYGTDMISNDDMMECLVYEEVVIKFLTTKFWPKIYHMARRSATPQYLPYSQMTKVIKAGITNEEISSIVQAALKVDINEPGAMPSMQKRINHLGHTKPNAPKRLAQPAADYYLDKQLMPVIQMFDKHWLKRIQARK